MILLGFYFRPYDKAPTTYQKCRNWRVETRNVGPDARDHALLRKMEATRHEIASPGRKLECWVRTKQAQAILIKSYNVLTKMLIQSKLTSF